MPRIRFVCLLAAAALCCYPYNFNDFMRQGAEAFNRGDLAGSLRSYQDALRVNPSDTLAKLHLAFVLLHHEQNAGNLDTVRVLSTEILQLEPQNDLAHWNLAIVAILSKESATAQRHCDSILDRQPHHPGCLFLSPLAAWTLAFPEIMEARRKVDMDPSATGPLPDPLVRQRLHLRHDASLSAGLEKLTLLRRLQPRHPDAAAYQNLIQRLRADLAPSPADAKTLTAEANRYVREALSSGSGKAQSATATLEPRQPPPYAELPMPKPPPPPPPPPPAR
jgi:tetratricopeptide (TPR) repeat protein